jgi:hypothetical protein
VAPAGRGASWLDPVTSIRCMAYNCDSCGSVLIQRFEVGYDWYECPTDGEGVHGDIIRKWGNDYASHVDEEL